MKKIILKIFFILFIFVVSPVKAQAVQFNLLVLPTNLFSVCNNYFCFPEVSNTIADDVITNLNSFKGINAISLAQIRQELVNNDQIRQKTESVLNNFGKNDKIDFETLNEIAKYFKVKSVLLISSYAINDKTDLRRSLWEVLEVSSAFKVTYPFELKTSAILTDCVNNLVMWSGKYTKNVSDTFGYYSATNQTQAISQLEKIKQYSYSTISKNISQNVFMRFFPKDVRTFTVQSSENKENREPTPDKFVPNALEHLSDPHLLKEINSEPNGKFRDFSDDDYIYQF
ncbi:MAG: hypothetical protein SPL73_03245 [Cyanobacteriota bacterium]|nr:hypothetical protein [Cyanobacteriota bacterium]MDY6358044.1 hypothetical protein [Cyanobacteriota bacterium]MDY6363886.1 hypothetical protein [Cyanobacteriota bacterium]MDY6383345.1 hypothetical protein [Cyanobacteriota bacterium]